MEEGQAKLVKRKRRVWPHGIVMLYLCHNKDNKNKGYEKH